MKKKDSPVIRMTIRVIGGCFGIVAGIAYGSFIITSTPHITHNEGSFTIHVLLIATAIGGTITGVLISPFLTIDPYNWLQDFLYHAPIEEVLGVAVTSVMSLGIAAMGVVILNILPWHLGLIISVAFAGVLLYLGVNTSRRRYREVLHLFHSDAIGDRLLTSIPTTAEGEVHEILIDTSALIDGRVAELAPTGFLQGTLVIPHFVLEELQRVADSSDPMRRARGRRGLNVAELLRHQPFPQCEVIESDFPGMHEDVDARLIKLARIRNAWLMTTDYNLNKLATIEDIHVLNINELSASIRAVASVGEVMRVNIVKEGREHNQGIGYLEDGTMVVVEGAKPHMGEDILVLITNVLQTPSGRMIFAQMEGADEPHDTKNTGRGEST